MKHMVDGELLELDQADADALTAERQAWAAGAEARQAAAELARTDTDLARVLEDVIALLEAKGTLALAELPQAAQDKIAERRAARAKL